MYNNITSDELRRFQQWLDTLRDFMDAPDDSNTALSEEVLQEMNDWLSRKRQAQFDGQMY